ncbi:hypothetical protein SSX86_001966 [Deinandra increscens subsp. villosa]|uniref:Uncharacterized protein n=1 Tax=Deinandra increscens subsp. villosa TaxID=3103831 RepID=A0AAP0H975_9ASTR
MTTFSTATSTTTFSIGDLHNDVLKSKQSFCLARLIDSDDRLSGSSSTLVQVGDVLDHGSQIWQRFQPLTRHRALISISPQIEEDVSLNQRRLKEATKRLEVVYPALKKVVLASSPGRKSIKHVYQQIMSLSLKAYGEGIPELSHEASNILI